MPAIPSTPTSFTDLIPLAESTDNLRKALHLLMLVGPATIANPDGKTLISATGQITIPEGMIPLGILDPKGIELEPKAEVDEIEIYNSPDPGRVDTVKIARSLTVTVMETWRQVVQSILQGADYSKVAPEATSKTLTLDTPAIPIDKSWRGLVLAYDASKVAGGALVDARWFPKLQLSDRSKETLAKKGAVTAELKFKVMTDLTLGTSCRRVLGGPGLLDLTSVLGYAPSA